MLTTKEVENGVYGNYTDSVKQWAAVATQCGDTREPPQIWLPPICRLTCQGQSSMTASEPPTIRSWEPTSPQSENKEHFLYCSSSQTTFYPSLCWFIHLDPPAETVKFRSDEFLFPLYDLSSGKLTSLSYVAKTEFFCRHVWACYCEPGHAALLY